MTSPPYGDSQTTVAYGQFSRLAAEWIGLPNARKVDKLAMGGTRSKETLTDSPVSAAVEKIRSVDEKRAEDVSAFYIDLQRSIHSIAQACSQTRQYAMSLGIAESRALYYRRTNLLLMPFVSMGLYIRRLSSETYRTNGCRRRTALPTLRVKPLQRCTKKTSSFVRGQIIDANRTDCLHIGENLLDRFLAGFRCRQCGASATEVHPFAVR